MTESWLPVPEGSDFTLANLPYGVVRPHGGEPVAVATRIGDHVVDLSVLQAAGLLDVVDGLPDGVFAYGSLNPFLACPPPVWHHTRARLIELLSEHSRHDAAVRLALFSIDAVTPLLPIEVGDYVDYYSSIHHARNMGLILRPDAEPLLPNWKRLPVGYHGRAGTVIVSGDPVVRPRGLRPPGADGGEPTYGPTERLDIELEVGAVVGGSTHLGTSVAPDDAAQHVFGFVLLNDWSARDIQAYEYVPLGPFLGKSFATTISPWVVPLDALTPHLVEPPPQDPVPAGYLQADKPWALDLSLEVALNGTTISRTGFAGMYWTFAQQLAHLTANGASIRPGDLFGSGTVSGPDPGSYGSLMELTWRGRDPIKLDDGSTRTFLEDGDTVSLTGWAGGGSARVGFGDCTATIHPAPN
jgi:fumarylacetoacetase